MSGRSIGIPAKLCPVLYCTSLSVLNHEDAMIYREIAAHGKLRKHIKCFWMLDHDYGSSFHDHEQLWADAHTELIFTSGERYFRKMSMRAVRLPSSFVIGPFQNELELFSRGRTTLVAARFWPWAFHSLSRVPMPDLKNTVRSCRRTLGTAGALLEQKIADIGSPDDKIATLQDALSNAIASAQRTKLVSRPIAIDIINGRGMIRVTDLLQKHGIQARQLERVFHDEIGVTAKVFSRIVRFNHAKKMIETNPDINLLTLTYECGYADQAHFIRNFREMFGITPAYFKTWMKELLRQFQERKPDVVFVQDTSAQPE
jgi:AraC-like DNA-binding protein